MPKSLIIINEPFSEMALGANTTLAQILAAAELGNDIYIYNLPAEAEIFPANKDALIPTIKLQNDQTQSLIAEYKRVNRQILIRELAEQTTPNDKASWPSVDKLKVKDLINNIAASNQLLLSEITLSDQIIQRVEPMKAPFPPEGNKNIAAILGEIKTLFPDHIFNCPVFKKTDGSLEELMDKQTPQDINLILGEEVSVPTAEFNLDDKNYSAAIEAMVIKYSKIFNNGKQKIVIKPKDSAQSLGVFALEFVSAGMNLSDVKDRTIEELAEFQTYKITSDISFENLKEVITAICCVQRILGSKEMLTAKKDLIIKNISLEKIRQWAQELYRGQVLVQPFLEGVRFGDIRANLAKDDQGCFQLVGCTYRKSARQGDENFTTCYTTGGALSKPVSEISKREYETLFKQCDKVLSVLNTNSEIRAKYKSSTEIGADFILVGNGEDVLLGEMNHHCPALTPISEVMNAVMSAMEARRGGNEVMAQKILDEYEGGLGISKKALSDLMVRQISIPNSLEEAEL